MKKTSLLFGLAAVAAVGFASPAAHARVFVGIDIPLVAAAPPPPPPAVVEVVPPGRPGWVWIRGHRDWREGAYMWVPGHWARPAYPGAVWVEGGWVRRGPGWFWRRGGWR